MISMKKIVFFSMVISVLTGSCTHYYYVPNVQNVPLFKEKNEFRGTIAFGGGDESESTEIQAAYSVSDHVGVMANFMSAHGGTASSTEDHGQGYYFDGALGYYKPINKYGVFEVYGGLGTSNQHHLYVADNATSDLSFRKIYIQPSYGFTFPGFDIALSARMNRISFNSIEKSGTISEINGINSLTQNHGYYFLEPAITVRGGWKFIKLQGQVSASTNSNQIENHFEDIHISIGMYFTIANRYMKNASTEK
jgi:hypothetical protein